MFTKSYSLSPNLSNVNNDFRSIRQIFDSPIILRIRYINIHIATVTYLTNLKTSRHFHCEHTHTCMHRYTNSTKFWQWKTWWIWRLMPNSPKFYVSTFIVLPWLPSLSICQCYLYFEYQYMYQVLALSYTHTHTHTHTHTYIIYIYGIWFEVIILISFQLLIL